MEMIFCDKSGSWCFSFLLPSGYEVFLCLSLRYLNLSLSPAGSIPLPPSFACLAVNPTVWDAMRTTSFLPVGGDVAEVLSLPMQALIAEKAFFPPETESKLPCACWCKHEVGTLCWLGGKCKQLCRWKCRNVHPASWLMSWVSQPSVAGLLGK